MKRIYFILVCLLALPNFIGAKMSPREVVESFGNNLSAWCKTNDFGYRSQIISLCDGLKKCRVEDKILTDYQMEQGFRDYSTFVLDSYLNMCQTLMSDGLSFQMTNVKVEEQDKDADGLDLAFVTAHMRLSGKINREVTDLFLVRDNKISGIYSYNSKLGVSHLYGSLIQALRVGRYTHSYGYRNGFAVVRNESRKYGLIDFKGNTVIPCIWDDIDYLGGAFAWGYNFTANENSCCYDLRFGGKSTPLYRVQDFIVGRENKVMTFSDGYAAVRCGEKWGYLSEKDLTYKDVNYCFDKAGRFFGGYAFVKIGDCGAIIDKKFNVILKDNDRYTIHSRFDDGLACIKDRRTNKWGFIDCYGKIRIQCIYDREDSFSEGICCVEKFDYPNNNSNTHTGCIDKNGNLIIPYEFVGRWGDFENGYIELSKKFENSIKGSLVDRLGKPLNGFSWNYDEVRYFCNGLARYKQNGKYGFLNRKGQVVVPAEFDIAKFFYNGYACVGKEINGTMKYGCINTSGVEVIPFIYDDTFKFENGIALVKLKERVGLIDVYGNSYFF